MSTAIIREEIRQYIEQADDRFLHLVYAMIQADQNEEVNLTQEQWAELDRRMERHKKGESQSFTWKEVKDKLLNKANE